MYCKDCEKLIPEDSIFCPYCGVSIDETDEISDGYDVVYNPGILDDPKTRKILMFSGIALVTATAAAVSAYFIVKKCQEREEHKTLLSRALAKKDALLSTVSDKLHVDKIRDKLSEIF